MSSWKQVPKVTKLYLAVLGYLIVLLIVLIIVRMSDESMQASILWKILTNKRDSRQSTLTPPLQIILPTSTFPPGSAMLIAITNTSIRDGPGEQYAEIALLESNQQALIEGVSQDRKWWAVNLPYVTNGRGWVSVDAVEAKGVENIKEVAFSTEILPDSTDTGTGATVLAIANVNVRSGPDIKFMKIGNLKKGVSAEIIGVSDDQYWWLIKLPGTKNVQGWISRDYVVASRTENVPIVGPLAGADQTLAPGSPYLIAMAGVNVRAGPDITFAVIGQLNQGQLAEIVGVTRDGLWWAIKYPTTEGGQGWIAAAYVKAENSGSVPVIK